MSELTLVERIVALERALRDADVPHAFGGALALGYYAEPRGTVDIDLNVFVPPSEVESVALPLTELGISVDEAAQALIERDGQARTWWDRTPVDLFFAYDAFHHAAAREVAVVPFAGTEIPILSAEHLIVCKTVFNRSKDWVDIEAIVHLDTVIAVDEVLRWVGRIVGDEDERYARIAAVLTRR